MTPIFLYTGKTSLSAKQVKQLEDAGYIVLRVAYFEDVQMHTDEKFSDRERMLLNAAFETIQNSAFSSTRDEFGRAVARRLTNNNKF